MEFRDMMDLAKIESIQNTLSPTETSVYRSLCRSYSKKFHTQLSLVFEMDPSDVMLALFEEQLDSFDIEKDLNQIHEQLLRIENPDYETAVEEDLQDFIAITEAKEKKRIKEGRPVHGSKSLSPMPSLNKVPGEKELPTQGFVNFEHLAKLEEEKGEF